MKRTSKFMTVVLAAVLAIGFVNNAAISSPSNFKYAVVDVQKVLESSRQFQAIKKEQNAKAREISQFIQSANKQLQAETDATKKRALETKLNNELNAKKSAMEKSKIEKLKQLDTTISNIITQKAKQNGYDMVVAKGIVLYSTGTDITNDIINMVK
ncbi:MAG: OmpH family outer membrane protein [Candidatus Gastranaerophilales bacterium]|nr:OmpH family outer membrane protein [Candidatus Gastranaerophilales bacterium]